MKEYVNIEHFYRLNYLFNELIYSKDFECMDDLEKLNKDYEFDCATVDMEYIGIY